MVKNLTQFKIFLVDDDVFALNLYQQYLINLGYENISTFSNGVDCLNAMQQSPKVLFIDHQMDEITGFDLLKKIKRIDPNAYVVVISAQENMSVAVDFLKFGAFDYIIKGQEDVERIEKVMRRIEDIDQAIVQKSNNLFKNLFSL